MRIEVSREDVLLDTGGGLKKAALVFSGDSGDSEEPFILHNVDVISTIDLRAHGAISHRKSGARHAGRAGPRDLAILALRRADASYAAAVPGASERRNWCELRNRRKPLAFSGIHVISPRIFTMIDRRRRLFHHRNVSAPRGTAEKRSWLFAPMNITGVTSARPASIAQTSQDLEQKALLPD